MTLSAIHNSRLVVLHLLQVVCDIGGYDFVSYSQLKEERRGANCVVCDIGGYDFVSYSQLFLEDFTIRARCL